MIWKIVSKLFWHVEKRAQKIKWNEIKKRFVSCGTNVVIDKNVTIICPNKFKIGNNSSISSYTTIYATFGVEIGQNCLISSNCGISSYNHIVHSLDRFKDVGRDVEYSKPVVIKDNVWIGMNACILPGITIGKNSIVGAGSVVTKDIGENEIWVGNPARFVKKINM